jgi:ATP-dependent RNA helicase DDX3X
VSKFCEGSRIKTTCVFVGENINSQVQQLSYSCDVLIATPGRLFDIMNRSIFNLSSIPVLILEEVDRMLDIGFEPQISQIIHDFDMSPPDKR